MNNPQPRRALAEGAKITDVATSARRMRLKRGRMGEDINRKSDIVAFEKKIVSFV